jgi:hypothetical protein
MCPSDEARRVRRCHSFNQCCAKAGLGVVAVHDSRTLPYFVAGQELDRCSCTGTPRRLVTVGALTGCDKKTCKHKRGV